MNAQNALMYVMCVCGLFNNNPVGPLYLSHFVQFTNYLMTRLVLLPLYHISCIHCNKFSTHLLNHVAFLSELQYISQSQMYKKFINFV